LHEKGHGHEPGIAGLSRQEERSGGHRYAVADVRGPRRSEQPSKVPAEMTWS
jgi:hypothetical protein